MSEEMIPTSVSAPEGPNDEAAVAPSAISTAAADTTAIEKEDTQMSTNGTPENPVTKMANENAARVEQWFGEYKRFEADQQKRTLEMIDESARVMKASVEYGMKMSEEWRKMALQAQKQTAELFTSKWF